MTRGWRALVPSPSGGCQGQQRASLAKNSLSILRVNALHVVWGMVFSSYILIIFDDGKLAW